MPSSHNFIRRIVTIRLYGLDDRGHLLVPDSSCWIRRSAQPLERIEWWKVPTLASLQLAFESLADNANVHTIVCSLEFDPLLGHEQPMPTLWRTHNRAWIKKCFAAHLKDLDPAMWQELEAQTSHVSSASSEGSPGPSATAGSNDLLPITNGAHTSPITLEESNQ